MQLPCNVNVEGFPFTINNYHNNCVDVEFIVGIFNRSKNVDTVNDTILLIPPHPMKITLTLPIFQTEDTRYETGARLINNTRVTKSDRGNQILKKLKCGVDRA